MVLVDLDKEIQLKSEQLGGHELKFVLTLALSLAIACMLGYTPRLTSSVASSRASSRLRVPEPAACGPRPASRGLALGLWGFTVRAFRALGL